MKAIVAKSDTQTQAPDTFNLIELPSPEPGEQDLLVRVVAVGMNPVDTKFRKRSGEAGVLGWDAYGIIDEIGKNVKGFTSGDPVYYAGDITRPGCNSEYHLVDHRIAALAPGKLSAEDAAAMPLTSITAWEGLFERLGFRAQANGNAGKSLMIIGGAGGVGSVAIQLARWSGLNVFATASRPETVDWCMRLGANRILNHQNSLHVELIKAGAGSVDAIFCTAQMEKHWQEMAECIRPQGRIVLIDDPVNSPDITVFKKKSVTISWEFMYTRSMFETNDISEQGRLLTRVAELLDTGILVSTRHLTLKGLTPENIQAMHLKQESGRMMGKQVLVL